MKQERMQFSQRLLTSCWKNCHDYRDQGTEGGAARVHNMVYEEAETLGKARPSSAGGLATTSGYRQSKVRLKWNSPISWIDASLQILAIGLLSLSVFSAPVLSASHLVGLLVVVASVLYVVSSKGRTVDQVGQRQVVLFLVILLDAYLIGPIINRHNSVPHGLIMAELGKWLSFTIFILWGVRMIRRRASGRIRSPLDLAVLLLFLVISASFLGPYFLLRFNGLPSQAKFDVFWAVFVAIPLYYIFRDHLDTKAATRRVIRMTLFPLAATCLLGVIFLWLVQMKLM